VTTGEPITGNPGPPAAFADDDTENCLCLVVGYAKKDGLIARVTAEAERRVMMSPALGDFLQLRYVDIGPLPDPDHDQSRPVRRIVADLVTARETAGRSHFALTVIARSATVIEELLARCAADPFLTELRMRFVGIASTDDRPPGNDVADIVSSPEGSWRKERNLVEALRQRGEELPRYFAAHGEPGLTRAELAVLRLEHVPLAAAEDGPGGDTGGVPGQVPGPDLLDGGPGTSGPAISGPGTTGPAPGPDVASANAADQNEAPKDGVGDAAAESESGRPPVISAVRRLPKIPWRRAKQETASEGDPAVASPPEPAWTAMGLVYLLMVADQNAAADPALDGLQAALLDVDRRLAAEPLRGYQVRVIHGRDGHLKGGLQDAGKLGRRGAKRLVKTADFTSVLKVIRGSLRRDGGLVQAIATAKGLATTAPAVVIFTADPPMAERDAAEVFGDLVAEATVVWVVPRRLEGLVSPAFGTESGAVVLGENQAVADDILTRLRDDALTS
jgi:hypothetical protein